MHFEVLLSRAARVLFSSKWEGIRLQDTHSSRHVVRRRAAVQVGLFGHGAVGSLMEDHTDDRSDQTQNPYKER
jgi:hypothetical protein